MFISIRCPGHRALPYMDRSTSLYEDDVIEDEPYEEGFKIQDGEIWIFKFNDF